MDGGHILGPNDAEKKTTGGDLQENAFARKEEKKHISDNPLLASMHSNAQIMAF
jgi:hypothetical protein